MKTTTKLRPTVKELLESRRSMMAGELPTGYSGIETAVDVRNEADPLSVPRHFRVHIIWDAPEDGFEELEDILSRMRWSGAAMVTHVEEVER